MTSRIFRVPPTMHVGAGAASSTGIEAKRLGAKKALIITDNFLLSSSTIAPIIESLKQQGLDVEIYSGVNSEPTLQHVEEGLSLLKSNKCDVIVGIGGGSPLDVAKAVSLMATYSGSIQDYMGADKFEKEGIPIIAVPTTAGTGSEATLFTIITDTERDVKMLIGSPYLMPRVAIVDPQLTMGMPRHITAATGIDALTHAIEAYVSRKAQPMSDIMALSAVRLLYFNLPIAFAQPDNLEARSNTLLGALQAGMAFSNASVALVHGMSRPIGALFHVPHGVSNAALLGEVMEFSLSGNYARYADIAVAMGAARTDDITTAQIGAAKVRELIRQLEIPSLSKLGVSKEKLEPVAQKMAEDAIASGSPGNNPRIATKMEIVTLYYAAL